MIYQAGNSITYLTVKNAHKALEFYKNAFGAEILLLLTDPAGGVVHSEIKIGNSFFGVAEENLDWQTKAVSTLGGSPASFGLYVEDCDKFFENAIKNGVIQIRPIAEEFYGCRTGKIEDPFGYSWFISTMVKEMNQEQMQKAMEKEYYSES